MIKIELYFSSKFKCAVVDCFHGPVKPGCYRKNSPLQCCPGEEVCREYFAIVIRNKIVENVCTCLEKIILKNIKFKSFFS